MLQRMILKNENLQWWLPIFKKMVDCSAQLQVIWIWIWLKLSSNVKKMCIDDHPVYLPLFNHSIGHSKFSIRSSVNYMPMRFTCVQTLRCTILRCIFFFYSQKMFKVKETLLRPFPNKQKKIIHWRFVLLSFVLSWFLSRLNDNWQS